MASTAVRRTVVSAQLLVQLASEHGLAPADALRGTGITATMLTDPAAEIGAAQELQLVRNLVARLGQVSGLGLTAGLRYHLSAYGIWGFALLSSPNFRAVADVVSRFLDLSYAFVRFRRGEENGAFWVHMDDDEIPDDVRQFLLERDFAACCNVLRELRPAGLPIRELRFRHPAPAHASRYAQIAGVDPIFDADRNAARFDLADVDAPLPQANPLLARMCLEQCRQLLARRQARAGLAGQVRERLLQMPGALPDAAAVARDLRISERSLRRHLRAEGTSLRALTDEVRQTLAEELLTTAKLKLDEVAERLGYAEPASLIHAFKRWKGVTPSAYRAQRRASM
ncbi:AraC family transcriptional regulator [Sinimarinibacterium thermocellulolyticum]|uniref:AraC family transcriptional regulator n=1 Tax=Sinimarinibacterium thermocellulolyticum TaxID=3170016 RepID=A0ABV2ACG7_9GAMM